MPAIRGELIPPVTASRVPALHRATTGMPRRTGAIIRLLPSSVAAAQLSAQAQLRRVAVVPCVPAVPVEAADPIAAPVVLAAVPVVPSAEVQVAAAPADPSAGAQVAAAPAGQSAGVLEVEAGVLEALVAGAQVVDQGLLVLRRGDKLLSIPGSFTDPFPKNQKKI